jgi:glycine dehydrogenase subunit 1
MKELAEQNLAKAHYAAQQFTKGGAKLAFQGAPFFNEFVIQTHDDPNTINDRLLEKKIVGGLPLKSFYPGLGDAALWCCTETTTKASIDAAAKEVAR